MMNGTVTMFTQCTSYLSKELAEKAKQAVEDANKGTAILQSIEETKLYESEDEVPILNSNKEDKCNEIEDDNADNDDNDYYIDEDYYCSNCGSHSHKCRKEDGCCYVCGADSLETEIGRYPS